MATYEVRSIGIVESTLKDLESAPRQPDEGAPEAWLALDQDVIEGLQNLRVGDEIIVITWLDRARRDVLKVHPRGDLSRAVEGVFSTRSPHRPNPVGLHQVAIAEIAGARIRVRSLEALDGTPIVDIKPVLTPSIAER
jgi:tRNA-Thr(GGU) m(6)t(6)A37 methyltransferase TsaA